jgi:hypothetical protein
MQKFKRTTATAVIFALISISAGSRAAETLAQFDDVDPLAMRYPRLPLEVSSIRLRLTSGLRGKKLCSCRGAGWARKRAPPLRGDSL